MMHKKIQEPFTKDKWKGLKAGDQVLLTGTIYTARDAVHKLICQMIEKGEDLPFPLKDSMVYYAGPTPEKPGMVIGSVGPTTSYRMDPYAPILLDHGQSGMIGKGPRSEEVIEAIKKNQAIYLAAIGGCGALISRSVKRAKTVAFPELGTEALRELYVENFPAVVVVDCKGIDLYKTGPEAYLKTVAD